MSIIERLRKTSTIKETDLLATSKFFTKKDMITTAVPMINVALSGRLDGGLTPGHTMFSGPSKHFKTGFTLVLVKAYLTKYPEGVVLFYDSEFGAPQAYFEAAGIDTNRVIHTPVTDIEMLKFDIMAQLGEIKRGDRVLIMIDSLGNIASKKEVDDANEGKSVADMSRAKALKSLFRMVTPHLPMKDIPLVTINHTYKEIGLYPKDIVSGGTGAYYGADTIFIVGRQQEKEGTDVVGYSFILNVEKSRFVKEKSKIPITVNFDEGISKWSGLLDVAMEGGFVIKPSNGWYAKVDNETGEVEDKKYRFKETETSEFWKPILLNANFREYVRETYQLGTATLLSDTEVDRTIEALTQDEDEDDQTFAE